MASFAASERAMQKAVADLHDYLWTGAHHDEARLLRRLEHGARRLDQHLGTRGGVARGTRSLTRAFQKVTMGADLFTFLHAVTNLTAAADRVGRNPKEAARGASELAVSLCIHLASVANVFEIVEGFESGRTDFAQFTSRLADTLEERGVLRAGEFRRAANQAFDVNALWDKGATKDAQRIMATAAVASVGFACVLFVDALRALGRYREDPYARLIPITRKIVGRLGEHP